MKYYNDCSTKCETPYKDNCRNRTEVISSCPANAVCSYFSDCSSKISSWSCKSGYTLSGNTCAADGCKIGYIYYTDGKCLPAANHDSGKTVLGIVVHITDGGQHGQIMAPWPIDENGGRLSDNSIRMKWAVPYGDITTLTNYASQSTATTDRDSCGNTAKITAKDSADKYPAAWATRKYAPTSATSGKWCLPAAGILTNIYNNLSSVQAAIGKVGGVALLSHGGMWSSSEKTVRTPGCFMFRQEVLSMVWEATTKQESTTFGRYWSFRNEKEGSCGWIAGPSPAMTIFITIRTENPDFTRG